MMKHSIATTTISGAIKVKKKKKTSPAALMTILVKQNDFERVRGVDVNTIFVRIRNFFLAEIRNGIHTYIDDS